MAPHERLHQQAAGAVGGVEGLLDLGGGPRERLLAQHVLAGLERADRPRHVERVRQRDVDRLDVGVLEKRLVAPVRALDPVVARVRFGPRRVAARDRDDVDAIGEARACEHGPVDLGGREDSEPDEREHDDRQLEDDSHRKHHHRRERVVVACA